MDFKVVQCFSCSTFQVSMVKKANKWVCKMCGENQSFKKIFFEGSAKDCRIRVQAFNSSVFNVFEESFDEAPKPAPEKEVVDYSDLSSNKFADFFNDDDDDVFNQICSENKSSGTLTANTSNNAKEDLDKFFEDDFILNEICDNPPANPTTNRNSNSNRLNVNTIQKSNTSKMVANVKPIKQETKKSNFQKPPTNNSGNSKTYQRNTKFTNSGNYSKNFMNPQTLQLVDFHKNKEKPFQPITKNSQHKTTTVGAKIETSTKPTTSTSSSSWITETILTSPGKKIHNKVATSPVNTTHQENPPTESGLFKFKSSNIVSNTKVCSDPVSSSKFDDFGDFDDLDFNETELQNLEKASK